MSVEKKPMNCRVKTQFGPLVLFIVFMVSLTHAGEIDWSELSQSNIEIQIYASDQGEILSSYWPLLPTLTRSVLSWDPSKELKKETNQNNERDPGSSFTELLEDISVRFDVSDPIHFRKAWFHLAPDLKVRGLFGLHDRLYARPLIILRMGIHGNVDELLAERFLAKMIYEDLNANFLILESLTSHAFLSQNKKVSIGGVDEGLQTFLILNELLKPSGKWSSLIKQVHLVGVSLGGPGSFVTTLLDQYNGQKIKSVVTLCPLINMKSTFEYHFKPGFSSAVVDFWNVRRLKALFGIYPKAIAQSQWWMTLFDWKPRFTPTVFESMNQQRKTPLISVEQIEKEVPRMNWPFGLRRHFQSAQSLYELNDFWPYYNGVRTPFKIIATDHDPLVINELNSELIFSGQQLGNFRSAKFERLQRGIHCGLAPVYQWDYLVKMMKESLQL